MVAQDRMYIQLPSEYASYTNCVLYHAIGTSSWKCIASKLRRRRRTVDVCGVGVYSAISLGMRLKFCKMQSCNNKMRHQRWFRNWISTRFSHRLGKSQFCNANEHEMDYALCVYCVVHALTLTALTLPSASHHLRLSLPFANPTTLWDQSHPFTSHLSPPYRSHTFALHAKC